MEKPKGDTREEIGRLDEPGAIRDSILPHCRLAPGQIWEDPVAGHRVGALDATDAESVRKLMSGGAAKLAVNDPPYNVKVGGAATDALFKIHSNDYIEFSRKWVANASAALAGDAHFYVWLGADVKDGFSPLPEFMMMMREFSNELTPRNFITMRNQRGYGTQKNWMWVRQELLYYIKGAPQFTVQYTDIPKILKGYYKDIDGKRTENTERGKGDTIRPGNVWVDIQQVFYRMEENVPGCYAQKPLKSTERILESGSSKSDIVLDLFSHSGTTLIACERLGRAARVSDADPVFAEIAIRRLERFRKTGKTGWQWNNPFPEISKGDGKA